MSFTVLNENGLISPLFIPKANPLKRKSDCVDSVYRVST